MIVYFDSSVLVAYYTEEERSDDARSIIGKAELPVISDIGIAELNVVLRRKQQNGFLSNEAMAAVFEIFDEHVREIFVRVDLDDDHLTAIRQLPDKTDVSLRTLDALHLAAAIDAGGAMATFDDRLEAASRSLGLEVLC